jgi:hypothetical protein
MSWRQDQKEAAFSPVPSTTKENDELLVYVKLMKHEFANAKECECTFVLVTKPILRAH